jgi:hypothetical protein
MPSFNESECKQCTVYIQYQGGVHSDQMVPDSQARRLDRASSGQKQLKEGHESTQIRYSHDGQAGRLNHMSLAKRRSNLNLKGNYQARIYSDQMVLMAVRQVGWIA